MWDLLRKVYTEHIPTRRLDALQIHSTDETQILPKTQPQWCDWEENCSHQEQIFTANMTLDWNTVFLWNHSYWEIWQSAFLGEQVDFSLSLTKQ